jgi:hypothetical protein
LFFNLFPARLLLDVCSSMPKSAQQSRAKVAHGYTDRLPARGIMHVLLAPATAGENSPSMYTAKLSYMFASVLTNCCFTRMLEPSDGARATIARLRYI